MNAPWKAPEAQAIPRFWGDRIAIARTDPTQGRRMIGSIAEEADQATEPEYWYASHYYLDAGDDDERADALDELEALIEADNAPCVDELDRRPYFDAGNVHPDNLCQSAGWRL